MIDNTHIKTLSKSELTIIKLIAKGLTPKEIAQIKSISLRTIEKHRGNIIAKPNISKSTNSLTKWAMINRVKL